MQRLEVCGATHIWVVRCQKVKHILCPEHSSSSYESRDNGTEGSKCVPELLHYGYIS